MNIVIITDSFPPKQHIASFRMESFAKYVGNDKDKTYVYTIGERDEIIVNKNLEIHYTKESVTLGRLKFKQRESKIIHYIKAGYNILFSQFILDKHWIWRKKILKDISELLNQQHIDVIITSYGDTTPHIIGLELKKRGYRFHWIADMRDEMSLRPGIKHFEKRLLAKLEKRVINEADLITTVSQPILESFKSLGKNNNFLEIRNGYDYPEVYESNFQEVFTISYTGSFYGVIKPDNFFIAICELIAEEKLPKTMKIKIIGNVAPIRIPDKLSSIVEEYPPVNHDLAIAELQRADVLLVIHPSDRKGVYTGKVFDYLPSNKIILSLSNPNDVIGALLEKTSSGFTVANENIEGIKRHILKCYELWSQKVVLPRKWDIIKLNSRKNQIKILSDYIHHKWEV